HFGVAPDAVALTAMTAASTRYSKAPTVRFHADGAGKQRDADDELRTTAEQYLAPVFAALEARRATA
ncbi:hypothetical protein, partial [Acinetobacter baumannii]